jgi:hypothetical protein
MQPTDENQHDYNSTLYDLGAAWSERYPNDAYTPGAFEWYRRGLIAPDEEWSSLQQKMFNDRVPFQAASSEVFGLPT